jgi:hypothetical protein
MKEPDLMVLLRLRLDLNGYPRVRGEADSPSVEGTYFHESRNSRTEEWPLLVQASGTTPSFTSSWLDFLMNQLAEAYHAPNAGEW